MWFIFAIFVTSTGSEQTKPFFYCLDFRFSTHIRHFCGFRQTPSFGKGQKHNLQEAPVCDPNPWKKHTHTHTHTKQTHDFLGNDQNPLRDKSALSMTVFGVVPVVPEGVLDQKVKTTILILVKVALLRTEFRHSRDQGGLKWLVLVHLGPPIMLLVVGNRRNTPWCSNPCFYDQKARSPEQKARIYLSAEPSKSLEKKAKTHFRKKDNRTTRQRRKSPKAGTGGSGLFRMYCFERETLMSQTRWVRFGIQIMGRKGLTEFSPHTPWGRNKLTEFGVSNSTRTISSTVLGSPPNRTRTKSFPLGFR